MQQFICMINNTNNWNSGQENGTTWINIKLRIEQMCPIKKEFKFRRLDKYVISLFYFASMLEKFIYLVYLLGYL